MSTLMPGWFEPRFWFCIMKIHHPLRLRSFSLRPGSGFRTVLFGLDVSVVAGTLVNIVIVVDSTAARTSKGCGSSTTACRDNPLGGLNFSSSAWLLAAKILAHFEGEFCESIGRLTEIHQQQMDDRLLDDNMGAQREAQRIQDEREAGGAATTTSETVKEFLSFERQYVIA